MKNAGLIIAGDFNFPLWNWETMSLKPNPVYTTVHQQFVDLLYDTGLDQIVKEPTCGENTLDLVLTNSPSLIPRVEVIPGISDHGIVYFEFKTKPDILQNANRPIFLYRRAN
ncbi:Hypp5350 [Branchiostoma lanceolatum]|uniref:Hypp5350 protein n=1 Tax=Branchiostoma lanceolatum TaxID=7740 RepID=A0A8K0F414_BRALA|nr:Hypp5350 [Branchiostoma lanceolatum]